MVVVATFTDPFEIALIYRAVNTEINLLNRLYPTGFEDQKDALRAVIERLYPSYLNDPGDDTDGIDPRYTQDMKDEAAARGFEDIVPSAENGWYCKHGTYIGDPYGPDYICGYCEEGV